ncbi:DNA-binding transcriptional regulator YiaG [Streptomyces tendae]
MSKLFDAVDALVASRSPLPPPAERRRLRQAHALTLDEVAAALQVRRATVGAWESGKTEPRPPEREAYARLLEQLATLYPAPESTDAGQEGAGNEQEDTAASQAAAPPAVNATAAASSTATVSPSKVPPSQAPNGTATSQTRAEDVPSTPPGPRAERVSRGSRRAGAAKAAPANTPAPSGVYAHGPLLVLEPTPTGR